VSQHQGVNVNQWKMSGGVESVDLDGSMGHVEGGESLQSHVE
jgi:hypothetical protein